MLRKIALAGCALMVAAVLVRADVIQGKFKSADAAKGTVTVTADGKDQTFPVAKEVRVTQPNPAKNNKKKPVLDVPGGLGALPAGTDITITTYKNEGKDEATVIHAEKPVATKKKKKD